ncbi:MAG: hypothetical protein JO011_19590 [Ktedonobacteraceae bacterium]|nr:hypothetical protein [Ktedonobacteraceae bacterium]
MSDEKKTTIYISPDEDLTSVRERLEKMPDHYITLVIPTETQLRSHLAWKLLRARVRELGKEVQIVSDSAQVRSVAKDVNFKVASSLEASPTGKSRPPSRSGRVLGNRNRPTGSILRSSPKRSTGLRRSDSRYPQPSANQWLPSTDRTFEQLDSDDTILEDDDIAGGTSPSSASSFKNDFPMTPERDQHLDFHHIDTSPPIRSLPPEYSDEDVDSWSDDIDVARSIREAASQSGSSFPETPEQGEAASSEHGFPEEHYGMTPGRHLGDDPLDAMNDELPPPPMRQEQRGSVPALDSFETQEHVIHDVPDVPMDVLHGSIEDEGDQGDFVNRSDVPPAHQWREPIAEDEQDRAGPSRVHGIRPRSSRTGRRSSPQRPLPPVTPRQDYGNDDDWLPGQDVPNQAPPPAPPVQPAASGTSRASRDLQSPQRTGRSGGLPQGAAKSGGLPSTPLDRRSGGLSQGTTKSGGLPSKPLDRRSGGLSQGTAKSGGLAPTPSSRVSGAITPQNPRVSGNLPQNAPRSGTLAPDQLGQGSRSRQLRPGATPGSRPAGSSQLSPSGRHRTVLSRPTRSGRGTSPSRQGPPSRAIAKRASRRRRPIVLFGVLAGIIVAILILLYWLLPTATVTVALPAQGYSAPVKLVAGPGGQTNAAAGTVQETTLKKDFTISGSGKATGTTKVGTASAKGTVFFINNGNQQITIPSNILLSTNDGTQFMTEDNIALGPKNSGLNRLPTLIQAQVSGNSGNVPVGSITVIPPDSKNQIAQYNKVTPADLNLQVTNDTATSGGGVGSAISVSQKDLDDTQATLSSQLQNSVNSWLQQQLAPGDVAGKPVITPTLTSAPKVDTIEQSGTFSASLKQSVEVPVVRSAALQSATIAQLNTALSQDKNYQNYQVVSDARQPVQIPQFTPISNGLSLSLNFKPTARIIQKINPSDVQRQVAHKSPGDAEATLKSQFPTVQSVQVNISPGFFPTTPLQPGNIHVQFVAGSSAPTKK